MRVYLQPPQPSRGLDRIATALRRYAPASIEVLSFPRNADLTVIYAIGRRDACYRQMDEILKRGKRYAVVQVCLRSTMTPNTQSWMQLWESAAVVWSYYDLREAFFNDGGRANPFSTWVNFYHAPLGVDASVFYPNWNVRKLFTVATSGQSYLSESVRECWLAAKEVEGYVYHVGPRLSQAKNGIVFSQDKKYNRFDDDIQLSASYQQCSFVSGLRRKEGFELPAAEGLLCGARPILFDTPDYRWAYKSWGEYIKETDRQGVVDQLVQLFRQGARPVTAHEREEAAHWFNWERICGEFWRRCL